MIKQFLGAIARTLGHMVAFVLIGLLLYFLFGKKMDVHAMAYEAVDTPMNTTYSSYFEGVIAKLPYDYQYVALSYRCSNDYYNRTCYVLCYGQELSKECEYLRFNYKDGYFLEKGKDTSFSYTGNLLYGNINNTMASLDKGGKSYESKTIILVLCSIFMFCVLSHLFSYRR